MASVTNKQRTPDSKRQKIFVGTDDTNCREDKGAGNSTSSPHAVRNEAVAARIVTPAEHQTRSADAKANEEMGTEETAEVSTLGETATNPKVDLKGPGTQIGTSPADRSIDPKDNGKVQKNDDQLKTCQEEKQKQQEVPVAAPPESSSQGNDSPDPNAGSTGSTQQETAPKATSESVRSDMSNETVKKANVSKSATDEENAGADIDAALHETDASSNNSDGENDHAKDTNTCDKGGTTEQDTGKFEKDEAENSRIMKLIDSQSKTITMQPNSVEWKNLQRLKADETNWGIPEPKAEWGNIDERRKAVRDMRARCMARLQKLV